MDKEIFTGMGKLVDKIEEVDTDGAGDCMGQVIRLRISIDITQSLEENPVHWIRRWKLSSSFSGVGKTSRFLLLLWVYQTFIQRMW